MKNIIITFVFLSVLISAHSQIDVKGIKLGEKYYGKKTIRTSLGGVSGTLKIHTMSDNTVYGFDFANYLEHSYYKYRTTVGGYKKIKLFVEGFEKKYGVKILLKTEEIVSGPSFRRVKGEEQKGAVEKDNILYSLYYCSAYCFEPGIFSQPTSEKTLVVEQFSVKIYNNKLEKLHKQQVEEKKKQEVLNDF